MDAICIARSMEVSGDSPVTPGATPQIKIRLNVSVYPVDGGEGVHGEVAVTRTITSSAAQWRGDFLAGIERWIENTNQPAGTTSEPPVPAGYVLIRVIGFVDFVTLAI